MLLALDTSILIDIDRQYEKTIEQIKKIVSERPRAEPAIAWATFYEFYYGKLENMDVAGKALEFLNSFTFLPMDKESTKIFTYLKKEKTNVKDFDLLIASVAMANNALLITKDTDFERVKKLNVLLLE